jgi:trk system potassium uptake protein TrkH
MNTRMIFRCLGHLAAIAGASMSFPLAVSLLYRDGDAPAFALSMGLCAAAHALLTRIKAQKTEIYAKDGFAITSLGWLFVSFLGSLPYMLSGALPSFADAFFESASGFTTTGATVFLSVEGLARGLLFWRSFTHWMGGMGFLLLMVAILPQTGSNYLFLIKAESPGPTTDKFVPKAKKLALRLYCIYIAMTAILAFLLLLGGMDLYDALIHAFGSASTGGFSSRNQSIAAYGSVYIEIVITVFVLAFGTNFSIYHSLLNGAKKAWKDTELLLYLCVVFSATLLIGLNLAANGAYSLWTSLRHSFFQVGTIVTTTGFSTADSNLWPTFSKSILAFLMLSGACAGSTAGGIKIVRLIILFKSGAREVVKIFHPNAVKAIRVNGKAVDEATVSSVAVFFFLYALVACLSIGVVSLDGKDMVTTSTAVFAAVSNVGPGFGEVGAAGNYSDFSYASKAMLSFCMIAGRLEILPVLILFSPSIWRRGAR